VTPQRWIAIGPYRVTINKPRTHLLYLHNADRELYTWLVLGAEPGRGDFLRPTIASGVLRRGVVTVAEGVLPDSVRDFLRAYR
jgi:hypothetical protein